MISFIRVVVVMFLHRNRTLTKTVTIIYLVTTQQPVPPQMIYTVHMNVAVNKVYTNSLSSQASYSDREKNFQIKYLS